MSVFLFPLLDVCLIVMYVRTVCIYTYTLCETLSTWIPIKAPCVVYGDTHENQTCLHHPALFQLNAICSVTWEIDNPVVGCGRGGMTPVEISNLHTVPAWHTPVLSSGWQLHRVWRCGAPRRLGHRLNGRHPSSCSSSTPCEFATLTPRACPRPKNWVLPPTLGFANQPGQTKLPTALISAATQDPRVRIRLCWPGARCGRESRAVREICAGPLGLSVY